MADDIPYSKREQDTFQREIFGRFDGQDKILDSQNKMLLRIESQTNKTSDRISDLESWSAEAKSLLENLAKDNSKFKNDRTRIYTLISVMVFVATGVGFLFYNLIDLKINNDLNGQLPIAVNAGISEYFNAHFSKTQIINNNN